MIYQHVFNLQEIHKFRVHAQFCWTWNSNCSYNKNSEKNKYFSFKLPGAVFIILINVQMPTMHFNIYEQDAHLSWAWIKSITKGPSFCKFCYSPILFVRNPQDQRFFRIISIYIYIHERKGIKICNYAIVLTSWVKRVDTFLHIVAIKHKVMWRSVNFHLIINIFTHIL